MTEATVGIQIERTQQYDLLTVIMTHPKVYPHITDDFSPPAADFRPIENPDLIYLLATVGGEVLGCFMVVPLSRVLFEIHTCLLPRAWGATGQDIASEAARWIWSNTTCRRLITNVPIDNALALRFARKAGMMDFGINHSSFQKDGRLLDQVMLGISKPEEQCQPQP